VDTRFEYLELTLVQQSWRLHAQVLCKGHASRHGIVGAAEPRELADADCV
jgi:hypothetical protein